MISSNSLGHTPVSSISCVCSHVFEGVEEQITTWVHSVSWLHLAIALEGEVMNTKLNIRFEILKWPRLNGIV